MLVLPFQSQMSWRTLPLGTSLLILLNVFVYAVLQSGDERRYQAVVEAYRTSELPAIEVPRYRAWLQRREDSAALQRLQMLAQQPEAAPLLMQADGAFSADLRAGRVVAPGDPQYPRWREERRRIDAMFDRVVTERLALTDDGGGWRLLSHQFLHSGLAHLLGNMVVLLVAGAFVEAAIGRARFVAGYLAAGVLGGLVHGFATSTPLVGASGAISGAMGMLAAIYGVRRVKVFYWVFVYFDTARVPALALLPIWLANEALQWAVSGPGSPVAYWVHLAGLLGGVGLGLLLRPRDRRRVDALVDAEFAEERKAEKRSSLLQQAQEAAARLDTRRAARLYRELVETNPKNSEYLSAYFNMALLGHDPEPLADAALRVLWFRGKSATTDLRKAYLQMSQPRVLQGLPVDEQLRLARRLVSTREDAAALRVLDRVLEDGNLRHLFARQIADCLLGLHTTYSRYGLKAQADGIRMRLKTYFPQPDQIGGVAPKSEPPPTIRVSTRTRSESTLRGPDTLYIDLSR